MNILEIDIEASPYVAEVFELWNVNIRPEQILRHSEVICFAYKWRGAHRAGFHSIYHDGKEGMLKALWDLLDRADVVVHYYGGRFDVPRINQEFWLVKLSPPSPYQQLDLLKTSRRFKLNSSKLDNVLKRAGLAGKVKHEGQSLWHACMEMDPAAWAKMKRYNMRDVTGLDDLIDDFGPWILGSPNQALYSGTKGTCPRIDCGGELEKRGFKYARSAAYQQYRCKKCGGWSRGTRAILTTDVVPED